MIQTFSRSVLALAAAAAVAAPLSAAQAQIVRFDGLIVASCTLVLSTPGVLGTNTAGTEIGSEQTGGVAATLGVVALGGAPTVQFTAPTMSIKPVAYTGTPTVSLKYSSTGGANQTYTSSASEYTSTNPLTDTVTLHAKAVDSGGLVAGSYRLQTTATCQQ